MCAAGRAAVGGRVGVDVSAELATEKLQGECRPASEGCGDWRMGNWGTHCRRYQGW